MKNNFIKLSLFLALIMTSAMGAFAQTPTFSADFDHSISLTDAAGMTAAFRTAHPSAVVANAFGKTAIINILNQDGCVGIRFYNAQDLDGTVHLVAVGVRSDNSNMTSGLIAERSICCKPGGPKCWPCSVALMD